MRKNMNFYVIDNNVYIEKPSENLVAIKTIKLTECHLPWRRGVHLTSYDMARLMQEGNLVLITDEQFIKLHQSGDLKDNFKTLNQALAFATLDRLYNDKVKTR